MTKKKRLGRGLEALLSASDAVETAPHPDIVPFQPKDASAVDPQEANLESSSHGSVPPTHAGVGMAPADGSTSDIVMLSVYEIDDNPFQPRRDFSDSEIGSLSESLKTHDILQPILVREVDGRHQLISGERRLRAAIQAGWSKIPARVRLADDRLVSELAIVENLQRKDLNAIEKALSFRRYLDEHGATQEELAKRLKIDRSTVANLMRLLELPNSVRDAIRDNKVTAGHARALLPLGDEELQIDFCSKIINDGWSVRKTEHVVSETIQELEHEQNTPPAKRKRRTKSQQIESLENQLKMSLGTKVEIKQLSKGKGKITIHFNGNDEFDRIRNVLSDSPPNRRVA